MCESTVTFNVLIATINRPTLVRQLESLAPQLNVNDCITIVFDGLSEVPKLDVLTKFKCTLDMYCEPTQLGYFGHGIRNKYSSILKERDFILHGDDDDIYVPNALELLRTSCVDKTVLYIAQMNDNRIGIIPRPNDQRLYVNNVGTPCGIVPWYINNNININWGLRTGGDGEFYVSASNVARAVIFLNFVIYIVRPR